MIFDQIRIYAGFLALMGTASFCKLAWESGGGFAKDTVDSRFPAPKK